MKVHSEQFVLSERYNQVPTFKQIIIQQSYHADLRSCGARRQLEQAIQTLCVVLGKTYVPCPKPKKIKDDDPDYFQEQYPEGLRRRRENVDERALRTYMMARREERQCLQERDNARILMERYRHVSF